MPQGIIDKLYLARDIGITVIITILIIYILYRLIDYILYRREIAREIFVDSLFNYNSFIQIDSNLVFLSRNMVNKKEYAALEEVIIEEQRNFKKIIDKYTRRKGMDYQIFCEYEDLLSSERHSELIILKLTVLGRIKSYQRVNKDGEELDCLKNI